MGRMVGMGSDFQFSIFHPLLRLRMTSNFQSRLKAQFSNLSGQEGQVGIVTLLIMTVMLSVGVSVVNRSTQDLRISRQEEDASRVFNAAEAGIEAGLSNLVVGQGSLDFGTEGTGDIPINVNYTVTPYDYLEAVVPRNEVVSLDTSTIIGGEQLEIEWAQGQDCGSNAAALEVLFYNTSNATVRREGITRCDRSDGFTQVAGGSDGYFARQVVSVSAGENLVRIKALYSDSQVRARSFGGWSMPVQYYRIRSEGDSGVGDEVKVVEVTRTLSSAPGIMDYVLYSGGSLVK